ncbi:hypothetical protein FQA39_LY10438 [Lamprigera yunnana]|nr:hypothetical protein FQA39_LY10438 [Lamprigera yunnana]
MKNYWGTKEESVMKSKLYGTKFSHSLKQLEEKLNKSTIVHIQAGQFAEEIHNKVIINETKNFDDLVKILKSQCERDRKRLDGSKYYNRGHYNNYQYGKYNHGGQERGNYNYTLFTGINSITITIIEIKDFRIIGDGITTEMDNTKIHTDLENRRGREEMMEPLKDMEMRIIDQVKEM